MSSGRHQLRAEAQGRLQCSTLLRCCTVAGIAKQKMLTVMSSGCTGEQGSCNSCVTFRPGLTDRGNKSMR